MKKYLKTEYIVIGLLCIIGFFLRVYVINNIPTTPIQDFNAYYEIAKNVSQNLGVTYYNHPIAFQGIGYSTVLGFWFKIFGDTSEMCAKWFNVVMSMGTIFLAYYILKKLVKSQWVRVAATIVIIFLPHHIFYVNTIGTEVISALILAGVIALQVTDFNWKIKYPILGIVIGFMSLTKPFFMAYPLVIGLITWMSTKNYKESLKQAVILGVVMAMVIAPWTYRNYKKFGRFIPISYNSGFNLYINNNENNIDGGWQSFDDIYKTPELQEKIDEHLDNPLNSVKIASDIELDFKPEASKWIKENPVEFLKLGVIRIGRTYFSSSWDVEALAMNDYRATLVEENPDDLMKIARGFNFFVVCNDIFKYILTSFSLMYIVMNFKDVILAIFTKKKIDQLTGILFMNMSYISLVYFVYEGQPRYGFIVWFLMAITACVMLDTYQKNKDIIQKEVE